MKVALDVMGGDRGPAVIVRGALAAYRELEQAPELVLYGDEEAIQAVLREEGALDAPLEVAPTRETIGMEESPSAAVRKKLDAPIVRAMQDLKAGRVQAFVSAGSTGAMVASAMVYLGRMAGVRRPAIATWFPGHGKGSVLLDVGANADNKPEDLVQFAVMGALFAEALLIVEEPRVGLLNIGEEAHKGSELYVRAHQLLREAPVRFVGNVEGRDIFAGAADVIVCDGFTGNVVLKLAESMAGFIMGRLAGQLRIQAAGADDAGSGLLAGLQALQSDLDYAEHGGAPLLGVPGAVMICHGKSNERAIRNAVRTAARFHEMRTIERTERLLGRLEERSLGA